MCNIRLSIISFLQRYYWFDLSLFPHEQKYFRSAYGTPPDWLVREKVLRHLKVAYVFPWYFRSFIHANAIQICLIRWIFGVAILQLFVAIFSFPSRSLRMLFVEMLPVSLSHLTKVILRNARHWHDRNILRSYWILSYISTEMIHAVWNMTRLSSVPLSTALAASNRQPHSAKQMRCIS